MPFIAIALFVALALGGGTAVAAERSHPGDAIYPIKTHVNDNVRAGLSAAEVNMLSIGSTIQTSLGIHTDQDSGSEATTTGSGDASTSVRAQGNLRINTDTEIESGSENSDENETGGVNVKL